MLWLLRYWQSTLLKVVAQSGEPRSTMRQRLAYVRNAVGPVLFTALVVLKLTGVISWSWWWVLSPLWAGIVLSPLIVVGRLLAGPARDRHGEPLT